VKGSRKPKTLGGAPRAGKWIRDPQETRPFGGKYRGSWILVLAVGALVLLGVGSFAVLAYQRLGGGLVAQYQESRRRPDWVRLERLPPRVVNAFLAVVDTASFRRVPAYGPHDGPMLTRDLLVQVHRLDLTLGDQAWRAAMVPLTEARLSRRQMLEFYLNRIYLGETSDWKIYGVAHAAEEYFGKDPRALTVGEAATLAGILLPPRLRDPEAAPGAVGPRRNEVLRRMLARGYVDATVFQAAVREPLAFQPGVDYAPMTRPAGWGTPPAVIQLPPELRPRPDSARASPR
jgi:Transglycosylase